MIFPEPLKKGDCVGLIAPASPVADNEEIELCIDSLKAMGYQVEIGNSVFSKWKAFDDGHENNCHQSYLAGTALERANDVNKMFADKKVKGIFCIRGGYGSAQILKYLDYPMICQHPKVFIGYSDITNLLLVLQDRCKLVSFHGPLTKPNIWKGLDAYSWKSLCMALNLKYQMEFIGPQGEELAIVRHGKGEGILTGGNLSVIARLCGTPYQPQTEGKMLFLEDIGESIPRLDMYLTQMEDAGLFDGIKGILLGSFLNCENKGNLVPATVTDLFFEKFAALKIPIMGNLFSDHRLPMGTLPLGVLCKVNTYDARIYLSRENDSFQ